MGFINAFLDACKHAVKRVMRVIARGLNQATGSKLSPHAVTITGLLMHIPIALLIATGRPLWAAGLLVVFGLFDTLDGELARLQGSDSPLGMFLDSTTDRMKEIMLYIGIAYFLVARAAISSITVPQIAALVAAAAGGSVLVSYINAWGEVVLSDTTNKKHTANQTFRGGLMRFEVRMFLIVFGLLSGWLLQVVGIIALLVWVTALERMQHVMRKLKHV